MTTATGKVVHLVSRDCCPYLDDYEPNYSNPAVAAVFPTSDKSVTWDPIGPTYDEPTRPRTKSVLARTGGTLTLTTPTPSPTPTTTTVGRRPPWPPK